MENKIHLYILISSDSVYDVCDESELRNPITEKMGVRPINKEERRKLNKDEDYGNGKLRCEEFLQQINQPNTFRYICLRLADVIGP